MRQIQLARSEISLSRFSFGTASLHKILLKRRRVNLLAAAIDNGFTHFDTAPLYGYGIAEAILGQLPISRRNSITVATKVGLYPPSGITAGTWSVLSRKAFGKLTPSLSKARVDWSVSLAKRSLEGSLRRLDREFVDILFLHEPDFDLILSEEWLQWLETEKASGRIKAWGLAGHSKDLLHWVRTDHPIAEVLQARDSLGRKEADILKPFGRELDLAFGYFASPGQTVANATGDELLDAILERNPHGAVLVTTKRHERLSKFADAAEREHV